MTRFLRIRSFVLASIFAICFLWSILLSVAVFVHWPIMNSVERNLVSIMLLVEFMTVILVPILLARDFQLWLDAARSIFIFTTHFGIAVWYACKVPEMKCVVSEQQTACNSIILVILIFSWVVPILALLYCSGLGYFYYRLSKRKSTQTDTTMTTTTTATTIIQPSDIENQPPRFVTENRPKSVSHKSVHISWPVTRGGPAYSAYAV